MPELFDVGTLYEVKKLPQRGWFLHAPCTIRDLGETPDSITFTVAGWGQKRFHVLLSGIDRAPTALAIRPLTARTRPETTDEPTRFEFQPQQRLLVITLTGPSEVQLQLR